MSPRTPTKKQQWLPTILCQLPLLIALLAFFSARWFVTTYGRLGFDSILFTLRSSISGVQSGLIWNYLLNAMLPTLALGAVWLYFLLRRKSGKYASRPRRQLPVIVSVTLSILLLGFAAWDIELDDYIFDQFRTTELYETNYPSPCPLHSRSKNGISCISSWNLWKPAIFQRIWAAAFRKT